MTDMILGITGTDGAGKGTVVDYLVDQKGFIHYSARAVFAEELVRQGRGQTRNDLRLMGNELRAKHGDDYIVTYYLNKYKAEQPKNVIIESIRAMAEVATLKQHGGVLLAVDADPRVRYERILARQSSSDHISFKEFTKHEALEMNDPDPHGMQKAKVMAAADFTVGNNENLEELYEQIEAVLTAINEQGGTRS